MNKTTKNGLLMIVSVVIVLVVVVCAGLTCLSWMEEQSKVEETVETEADVAEVYTYEDILAAKEEGRQELLDEIKEKIEAGYNATGALRQVYADTDEILVATDGEIVFVPVSENVAKSTFLQDNLQVLESGEFQYVENGEVTSHKGIDVSRFQEEIDWEQVASDGVEYAFIRVGIRGYGSGALVEDDAYETNVEGALAQGIAVGVYFYSQAITVEEAIEEADFVLEAVDRYDGITYPIVIDIEKVGEEGARADALTKEERTQVCLAFCERIVEAGYTPMIYGNTETFTLLLDIEQIAQYDRWIAFYDEILCFPYEFSVWQYTHNGTVAGIDSSTDLNLSFKEW